VGDGRTARGRCLKTRSELPLCESSRARRGHLVELVQAHLQGRARGVGEYDREASSSWRVNRPRVRCFVAGARDRPVALTSSFHLRAAVEDCAEDALVPRRTRRRVGRDRISPTRPGDVGARRLAILDTRPETLSRRHDRGRFLRGREHSDHSANAGRVAIRVANQGSVDP